MGRRTELGNPSSTSHMLKKPSLTTIVAILNVPLPTTSLDILPAPDVDDCDFASPGFWHRWGHLTWHRVLGVFS